jgi:hypothetical protein
LLKTPSGNFSQKAFRKPSENFPETFFHAGDSLVGAVVSKLFPEFGTYFTGKVENYNKKSG